MPSRSLNRVLIVHPSRGRPAEALKCFRQTIGRSTGETEITYIFSLDSDDPRLGEYQTDFQIDGVTVLFYVYKNSGCCGAVNRAYSIELLSRHDFVILHSDDMELCDRWDLRLKEVFNLVGYDKVIKTKQGFNDSVLTLQIAGAQAFIEYGTFFWPEYKSLFGDNDLTEWARATGRWVEEMEIYCPHLHPWNKIDGAFAWDETYRRENEQKNTIEGRRLFENRKNVGFPAYRPKPQKEDFIYPFQYDNQAADKAMKRLICSMESIRDAQGLSFLLINASDRCILKELASAGNEFRYSRIKCPRPGMKGRILNHAFKNLALSDYIFQSDIDLIYPLGFYSAMGAIPRIDKQGRPVRLMFANYYLGREIYTSDYGWIKANIKNLQSPHPIDFAAGNGLIHRASFNLIGGYFEGIVGWGQEDIELNERLSRINRTLINYDVLTYHLWHENNKPNENQNKYTVKRRLLELENAERAGRLTLTTIRAQ